jgi:predicted RNase H-like HicB family nuclease
MKINVVIHEAEECGCWAEVPALPGCFTQGDSREELVANLREAVEGCLLGPEHVEPSEEGGVAEEIDL